MKVPWGFTLLEAVVALTILSTSGLAIYSWLGTSLDGLRRVNNVVATRVLADDLQAYFRTVTIESEQRRSVVLNGYDIEWQATLLEPERVGRFGTGVPNGFRIGLYRVDIAIFRDGSEIGSYETRLVGYRYGTENR